METAHETLEDFYEKLDKLGLGREISFPNIRVSLYHLVDGQLVPIEGKQLSGKVRLKLWHKADFISGYDISNGDKTFRLVSSDPKRWIMAEDKDSSERYLKLDLTNFGQEGQARIYYID